MLQIVRKYYKIYPQQNVSHEIGSYENSLFFIFKKKNFNLLSYVL